MLACPLVQSLVAAATWCTPPFFKVTMQEGVRVCFCDFFVSAGVESVTRLVVMVQIIPHNGCFCSWPQGEYLVSMYTGWDTPKVYLLFNLFIADKKKKSMMHVSIKFPRILYLRRIFIHLRVLLNKIFLFSSNIKLFN